jgi:predicted nucleotidyltransferase component of viral defense system
MNGMKTVNMEEWVAGARKPGELELRQAVHILCRAISESPFLSGCMVMKGGILLSILHSSSRYTRDIDFSTDAIFEEFDKDAFLRELGARLSEVAAKLDYNLDCRIQSEKKKPDREDASFPTLEIKIAYAQKGSPSHRKLLYGNCPTALKIDFSFNEKTRPVGTLQLPGGLRILCYRLADIVAEKYRAMIQQVSRNRTRRQDAYDIFRLIDGGKLDAAEVKLDILQSLRLKAASRGVDANRLTLRDSGIVERSAKDYQLLEDEIQEALPPFNKVYKVVRTYYEALPWQK